MFLSEGQLQESWKLVEPDAGRLTKGEAAIALLEHLDATRPLGRALRALRLAWFVGFVDWVIKKLRPFLSHFAPKVEPVTRFP